MKNVALTLAFVLVSTLSFAQHVKKSHIKTLTKKAELIQLKEISKESVVFVGDITTPNGKDKARFKQEIMKYFSLRGFTITTNQEDADLSIEGGYNHDLIAPGQILGFDISITDSSGNLVVSYSKRSNSFVGPTFDTAIVVYLLDNLR